MKLTVIPVLFLVICALHKTQAYTTKITLTNRYCSVLYSSRPELVEPGDSVQVIWDEKYHKGCIVVFKAVGRDDNDLYKLCIKPVSYKVEDCDVSVSYSQVDHAGKTYSCHSTPLNWCTEAGADLTIRVTDKTSIVEKFLPNFLQPSTKSSFIVEVYTEEVYTVGDYAKLGVIIGAAGGGLVGVVLLAIFLACIIQHMRSKYKHRDECRNRGRGQELAMSSRTGQSQANDTLISPSSQPVTPTTVNVQIDGKNYKIDPTDLPPPSYDEVMALEAESSRQQIS